MRVFYLKISSTIPQLFSHLRCSDHTRTTKYTLFGIVCATLLLASALSPAVATDFYVATNGDDQGGAGTQQSPWKTVSFALRQIKPNEGHTLNIGEGNFFESSPLAIPVGINVVGSGIDKTLLKSARSFYYNPPNPESESTKFLMRLESSSSTPGNQDLRDFTIDGSGKQLHGGIYLHNRSHVQIHDIKVQNTNFSGIWLLEADFIAIRNVSLINCAWGSADWCSGALMFAHSDNVELDHLNIDEGKGYGIKTFGHEKDHVIKNFKLHDSRISVNPEGLWQNGKAPNITVELWANEFINSEIYNCTFDNHLSIVNCSDDAQPTGNVFRIHHNFMDLKSRAKDAGYGLELTIHDAEVDHNIFYGGFAGICTWAGQKQNWSIHHNVFYAFEHIYPTGVIYAHNGGIENARIYNNTVEMIGKSTVNFIGWDSGSKSRNITIQNNLIINSNEDYLHYPNRFVSIENGATVEGLVAENNVLHNISVGNIEGVFRNNISQEPKIRKIGIRPFPYYLPESGSPVIDSGIKLRDAYRGTAPDIGAYESH